MWKGGCAMKQKNYQKIIGQYAQKLFHIVIGIVKKEELAEVIVEKVFILSYDPFFEMEKEDWEKYIIRLATKTAINCNRSSNVKNDQLIQRNQMKKNIHETNRSYYLKKVDNK